MRVWQLPAVLACVLGLLIAHAGCQTPRTGRGGPPALRPNVDALSVHACISPNYFIVLFDFLIGGALKLSGGLKLESQSIDMYEDRYHPTRHIRERKY